MEWFKLIAELGVDSDPVKVVSVEMAMDESAKVVCANPGTSKADNANKEDVKRFMGTPL